MAAKIEGATRKDYFLVPVEMIFDDAENYRRVGDVAALAASIAAHGVEEPLRGFKADDDRIQLVDGFRRMAAVHQLATEGTVIEKVPVILQEKRRQSEHEVKLTQLVLNEHRQDAQPIETAKAIDHLIRVVGCEEAEVADRLGWDRQKLRRHLKLLEAAPRVRKALEKGEIGVTAAAEIITKNDTREAQETALAAAKAASGNGRATARSTHAQAPKKRIRRSVRSRKAIQEAIDTLDEAGEVKGRGLAKAEAEGFRRGIAEALAWVIGGEQTW